MISAVENSNKFQKPRFWKEKSVEDVVKLEGLPFNSSIISFHIWLFKKSILHCKTMFICWVSLLCNGFTLGPTAQATLVYLWRKVVCLFCFVCTYEIHQTKMLQITFLVLLISSLGGGGVHGLGSMVFWTCSAKVLEYWLIFSLKFKLNRSWKFWRNWNVPFGVVGKMLMSRI